MTVIKCIKCKVDKQEIDFETFRGKLNKSCRECRVKNNLWYSQDLNGRKTKAKEYYRKIKDSIAQYRSDLRLDRKYKITRTEWNTLLQQQNNKCPICGLDFTNQKPCVDHDHNTGKVRGLLHRKCNLKLQSIEDIEFAKNAQLYLESKK